MTVELGCRLLAGKEKRGMRLESGIFMTTSLLQGLQISLWGLHDSWESAQILCLHASFLLYLMARTGQSSQDRLGIMVWIDLIYTSCLFPLKYFFLGVFTLPYKTRPKQELSIEERHNRQLHKGMILVSIFVALILLYLLPASSVRYYLLSDNFGNKFSRHLLLCLTSTFTSKTVA